METPSGTKSVTDPRRWAHSLLQYGALGAIVAAVIGVGLYLLHIFVPIWVARFEADAKAQTAQTEALKEVKSTLSEMRVEMKNDRESIAATISVTCARRR